MKSTIHKIAALSLFLMLFCGCSRTYSGQYFSFPPGTKPHENNWEYLCKIINWQQLGKHPVEKGKRKIEITINDKDKNKVLEDAFEIESASIETKIKWEKFEKISLDLYEVGNQYADDDYNKQLITTGPRHLTTLKYVWDGKKYIKSVTEPLG